MRNVRLVLPEPALPELQDGNGGRTMKPPPQIMNNLALGLLLQKLTTAGHWPDRIEAIKNEIKRRKQNRTWKLQ